MLGVGQHDDDYVPPTWQEIAADLVAGKSPLETEEGMRLTRPADAVAHVIRAGRATRSNHEFAHPEDVNCEQVAR